METVSRLRLPIKFFILSNQGYASIRTSQARYFRRLVAADPASGMTLPDVLKVASAYGLATARIASSISLAAKLREVLQADGPVVCEVMTPPDETRAPSLVSVQRPDGSMASKPLEDLWPFLSRDEFRANMIVPPIEE
jgi:acetolactate synthase I/II/III large subunit